MELEPEVKPSERIALDELLGQTIIELAEKLEKAKTDGGLASCMILVIDQPNDIHNVIILKDGEHERRLLPMMVIATHGADKVKLFTRELIRQGKVEKDGLFFKML